MTNVPEGLARLDAAATDAEKLAIEAELVVDSGAKPLDPSDPDDQPEQA